MNAWIVYERADTSPIGPEIVKWLHEEYQWKFSDVHVKGNWWIIFLQCYLKLWKKIDKTIIYFVPPCSDHAHSIWTMRQFSRSFCYVPIKMIMMPRIICVSILSFDFYIIISFVQGKVDILKLKAVRSTFEALVSGRISNKSWDTPHRNVYTYYDQWKLLQLEIRH